MKWSNRNAPFFSRTKRKFLHKNDCRKNHGFVNLALCCSRFGFSFVLNFIIQSWQNFCQMESAQCLFLFILFWQLILLEAADGNNPKSLASNKIVHYSPEIWNMYTSCKMLNKRLRVEVYTMLLGSFSMSMRNKLCDTDNRCQVRTYLTVQRSRSGFFGISSGNELRPRPRNWDIGQHNLNSKVMQ